MNLHHTDTHHQGAYQEYYIQRASFWDQIALTVNRDRMPGKYFHRRVRQVYQFLIPPGARVLELGCGTGNLLAALQPSSGVGVDFSEEMIAKARQRYPDLVFYYADAHNFNIDGVFDYILLSDLINDAWDVQCLLENLQPNCHPGTRLILNYYSRLWQPL